MSATSILGQVPTILGSLTTLFTPPPACTVAVGQTDGGLLGLGLLGGGAVGNFAFLGQTCSRGQPADDTACWPPMTTGAPARGVYSPGIECPAGYATACSATAGGSTGWPMQFSLGARETAVGCCPSGFGCANINGQTCTMLATSTVVPTVTCDGNKFGALAFNTVDPAASVTAFSLFAPMIQINFQSSDLPSSSSSSAQPSTAAGVVPVPVPTSGAASSTQSSPGVSTVPIRTTASSSTFQTSVSATTSTSTSTTEPQSTTTSSQQPDPPIESNTADTDNPSIPTPTPSPSSSSSPAADLQAPDNRATTFPQTAAVGIGVGGGVAVLLVCGSALIYFLRRRRLRREDEELDRLYGLGKLDTNMTGELPGFYRGQRPADLTGGRPLNLNF